MAVKLPKVGRVYRYTDASYTPIGMTYKRADKSFEVSSMSKSGGTLTKDVLFDSTQGEWCIACFINRDLLEVFKRR